MSFFHFYLIALVPALIGAYFWWSSKRVVWWEWLACAASGFALSGAFHVITIRGMTADEEVWSGEVSCVRFRPEWKERYTVTHHQTHTRSDGSTYTTSYKTTHYTTHPDKWFAHTTLDQVLSIDKSRYRSLGLAFGGESRTVRGDRSTWRDNSTMVSGDPNDYVVDNKSDHVEPVVSRRGFKNRVKVSPSVFSYKKLSKEESKALPDYPLSSNPWRSGRVINTPIKERAFDEMMAKLGPDMKVNIVVVGLPLMVEAMNLEAKWVGGKKNDLVLCHGKGWSYVFGWTEKEQVKRELEGLLLLRPVNTDILPEIDKVVRKHYELVDWSKFDYLSIQPRAVHLVMLLLCMCLVQWGMHWWAIHNSSSKSTSGGRVFGGYR